MKFNYKTKLLKSCSLDNDSVPNQEYDFYKWLLIKGKGDFINQYRCGKKNKITELVIVHIDDIQKKEILHRNHSITKRSKVNKN